MIPGIVASGAALASWSPADLAGLKMWLKADAMALADADAVSSWTDSSGLGNHVVQATGGSQPSFRTNVLNGKPVVRFDGGDRLTSSLNRTQPNTVFAVLKFTTTANQYALDGGGGNQQVLFNQSSTSTIKIYAGSILSQTCVNTNFNVVAGIYNSTVASKISVGGATVTGNAGTGNATGTTIGSSGAAANFFLGDIAEVIFYDTALSDVNRRLVEAYLGTKYGITVI